MRAPNCLSVARIDCFVFFYTAECFFGSFLHFGAHAWQSSLNMFMSLGRTAWREARETLIRLLSSSEGLLRDDGKLQEKVVIPKVRLQLRTRFQSHKLYLASKRLEAALYAGTAVREEELGA